MLRLILDLETYPRIGQRYYEHENGIIVKNFQIWDVIGWPLTDPYLLF